MDEANVFGASTEVMMVTAMGIMHVLTPKITQLIRIFAIDNKKLNQALPTIIGFVVGGIATLAVEPTSWMQGMYIYISAVSGAMSGQTWRDVKKNSLDIPPKSARKVKRNQVNGNPPAPSIPRRTSPNPPEETHP